MNIIKTEGIVIKKMDLGESDKLLVIFSKTKGKIVTVLKGIRKSKKRDKLSADLVTLSTFILIEKNGTYFISDLNMNDPFMEIRNSLLKTSVSMYILKILDLLLNENEKNNDVFEMSKKFLQVMKKESEKEVLILLMYYVYRLIKNQGLDFELEKKGLYFDIENGKIGEKRENYGIVISEFQKNIINLLKIVDRTSINGLKLKGKECIAVIEVFEKYLEFHLSIKVKLKEFIIEEAL